MPFSKYKTAIISSCCVVMLFAMLLGADVHQSPRQKANEELIRYTILEAEAMLNDGYGDLTACISQWRRLTQIMPGIDLVELKAKAELLRLLCVKRSLELIPRRAVPELAAWLTTQADHIYFCAVECFSWMVKPGEFWDLHDKFPDLIVTDDIAWAGATNPWGHGCEGSANCEISKWDSSMGEYLKRHPDGKYVLLALEKLVDICQGIQAGALLSPHDGSVSAKLQKIIELVGSIAGSHQAEYYKHALETLESTRDLLRKAGGTAGVRNVPPVKRPSILEGSLDTWLEDWFRARECRDLNDFLFYWRELKKIIPSFKDEQFAARAKLMRLLCLKRTLVLLDKRNAMSHEIDSWREEVKEFTALGAVKRELFWELQKEYAHLPVADDIAWVAASNLDPDEDVFGPDIYHQLVKLDLTMVRYLRSFPDGKYARIALSRIISFCRSCRGEDWIVPPPQDFNEMSHILGPGKDELGRIYETLKRVSSLNNSDRIARQAMSDFEKTFKGLTADRLTE